MMFVTRLGTINSLFCPVTGEQRHTSGILHKNFNFGIAHGLEKITRERGNRVENL